MLKIYLAGPDVFAPSAVQHGKKLKALCAKYGFCGLFPIDAEANPKQSDSPKQDTARSIFQANIQMIQSSDIVMANLSNFRGAEPDSGTAFEVGFAFACGKPVFGYTESGPTTLDRVGQVMSYMQQANGTFRDAHGYHIEDFGLPANLMLAIAAKIVQGGPEECLKRIAVAYPPYRTQSTPSILN